MLAAAPFLFYGTDSLDSPALVCGVGDAYADGKSSIKASPRMAREELEELLAA
jgi:hypothetical protein